MIQRRSFQADDIKKIDAVYLDKDDFATRFEKSQPNATVLYCGRVEACGGLVIMWKGVAEGWIVISRTAHHRSLIEARTIFDEWVRDYDLKRVQAVVRVGWQKGKDFLEWMGLECEADNMRNFFEDGSGASLFARIR